MIKSYDKLSIEELVSMSTTLIDAIKAGRADIRELYSLSVEYGISNKHILAIHKDIDVTNNCLRDIDNVLKRNISNMSEKDLVLLELAINTITASLMCIDSHLDEIEDKITE